MSTVPWHQRTMLAFDLETTGTNPETARIVTASIVCIDPLAGSVDTVDWLADPGVTIPDEATAVHGITTSMARTGGRPAGQVANEVATALALGWHNMHPVVIFNAAYDLTVLDRELRRHCDEPLMHGSVVDPMVIDKQYARRYGKGQHTLGAACAVYEIDLSDTDAHSSSADALAAARVAWKQARRFPRLAEMRLPELHARQAEWYAAHAADLQRFFDRKGIAERVSTEWPLRSLPDAGEVAS